VVDDDLAVLVGGAVELDGLDASLGTFLGAGEVLDAVAIGFLTMTVSLTQTMIRLRLPSCILAVTKYTPGFLNGSLTVMRSST
jgi:hypothetical protein